ncbi:hypothetical protein H4687_008936 [Streptomyces stelliscabiei]|uniref:Short-chain dehydrogenase n=1 Tax=Streptomyces stelliscabiei TaxID=146820 RepID=A0A8I0PES6_9ACTN|nr:hypothetical protein [Streptomyces stelliscabiei]
MRSISPTRSHSSAAAPADSAALRPETSFPAAPGSASWICVRTRREIAADISSFHVVGFTPDVCDRSALDDVVAHPCERSGRVDVVIANAGIVGQGSTLRATPAPAVDKVLVVNINGVVNTVNAAMEQIIANQGQVVLISPVFAFLNGVGAGLPDRQFRRALERELRVRVGIGVVIGDLAGLQQHVQRHDHRAGLEDADADAGEVGQVGAGQCDLVARLDPARDEQIRDTVGGGAEGGVRDVVFAEDDRGALRVSGRGVRPQS